MATLELQRWAWSQWDFGFSLCAVPKFQVGHPEFTMSFRIYQTGMKDPCTSMATLSQSGGTLRVQG